MIRVRPPFVDGVEDVARLGLLGRAVFYAILAGITVTIALHGSSGAQDNAHGALAIVARNTAGKVAIAVAALGFLLYGIARLHAAITDGRPPVVRRVLTGLQGAFFLVLTLVPISFLSGSSTGSEQSQKHSTARLLGLPGGQALVVVAGLVVLVVCGFQVRTALSQDWEDSLRTRGAAPWVKRVIRVLGTVGIAARAIVFVPIGVFLVIAAVQADPQHADGLDAELAALGRHWWGRPILGLVALGLLVFAAYSVVEARYRDIDAGE